ncbi:MAG TPA: hypothetical protein VF808_05900 [Ktedonobacterales bacterium]
MPSLSSPSGVFVAGMVVDAATGWPLPGLRIVAARASAANVTRGELAVKDVLGGGTTDVQGRFRIGLPDAARARSRRWLFWRAPRSACVLRVEGSAGAPYLVSPRITIPQVAPVTLRVHIPILPISAATWADFGARLERTRIGRLNDAVRQLMAPPRGGAFADWDIATRLSVVAALEQAFLDPSGTLRSAGQPVGFLSARALARPAPAGVESPAAALTPETLAARDAMMGKARAFGSIASVDWPLDAGAFKAGDPAAGVTRFESLYRSGTAQSAGQVGNGTPVKPAGPRGPEKPASRDDVLGGYRDYLRGIWVGLNDGQMEPGVAIDALNARFHQDFRTYDEAERPANTLLADIVQDILVSTGGISHGFGLNPARIEDRGLRTPREYLDYLISLTSLSAAELELRFRLDLRRADSETSSRVWENIATLQGFYRDSFQNKPETPPFIPPAHWENAFSESYAWPAHIPAPFFLEYEEWLATRRAFFPENVYQIRPDYPLGGLPTGMLSYYDSSESDEERRVKGEDYTDVDFTDLNAAISAGLDAMRSQEYGVAGTKYDLATAAAIKMLAGAYKGGGFQAAGLSDFPEIEPIKLRSLADRTSTVFQARRTIITDTLPELEDFLNWFDFADDYRRYDNRPYQYRQFTLVHVLACMFPVLYGDLALAQGKYAEAVTHYLRLLDPRYVVGLADTDTPAGWGEYQKDFQAGDLPYTFDLAAAGVGFGEPDTKFLRRDETTPPYPDASIFIRQGLAHPVEERFFRLRLGAALLEWADTLYRRDDSSSTARARELYKGVLYLHGVQPPTAPDWGDDSGYTVSGAAKPWLTGAGTGFVFATPNPAVTSQTARAQLGFYQIAAGLNYFGYHADLTPTLRYRPLKDAADHYAGLARGAQQDWLAIMGKIEDAERDAIVSANLLNRVKIQLRINEDQALDAQYAIDQAQRQVESVRAAIEAKKKEIEDHDSFWGQVSDFASGFKDALSSIGGADKLSSAYSGATDSGGDAAAASASDAGGDTALVAGGSVLLGYGVFIYASYMSMSGMADAANQRRADLDALENTTLPAAQDVVKLKQRDLEIENLQAQVIQSDADLAHDLIRFQAARALSPDFWARSASVIQRLLRRYLELGARTAWLAERALAYEQDREIRLIRFDYFPRDLFGYTGADRLQADLAELEASRLAGLRETVPVKHTFSLLRDFPLQFGQLLKTGRCGFRTEETAFRLAYPGLYGYRIRAVTAQAVSAATRLAPRGLVTNQGISVISRADGTSHLSARPSDALAISAFQLRADMAVYGLPDEALYAFEGSGVDTLWEIEFSAAANSGGRDGLADVLFTLDMRASYSRDLYQTQVAAPPAKASRLAFLSARRLTPKSLDALRTGTATVVTFAFDARAAGLPRAERNRTVSNLMALAPGLDAARITASLQAGAGAPAPVVFERGVALSNVPPVASPDFPAPVTPSPLNVFAGAVVDQTYTLTIDRAANPGVDFSDVRDILLGIDYAADQG